jgi:hypothetical protein
MHAEGIARTSPPEHAMCGAEEWLSVTFYGLLDHLRHMAPRGDSVC